MRDEILAALKNLEDEKGFKVQFACESGSRAWGFASPDSDYDVRFVYTQPLEWYLRVSTGRDTCDRMLPHDLDVSGWELRKTLGLFSGCNVALFEWLGSPVVYFDDGSLATQLRDLIPAFFNPRKAMRHYLSMAKGIANDHLAEQIKIKKLFYIVRPICACRWIEDRATMPPTAFTELSEGVDLPSGISDQITHYLDLKKDAIEAEPVSLSPVLGDWIRERLAHYEETANDASVPGKKPEGVLDKVLYDAVANR